jgi:hypothetical protein
VAQFNARETGRGPADPLKIPPPNRPDDCSAAEYEAALWRETERSLRQDPSRWRPRASATQSFSSRARARSGAADDASAEARRQLAQELAREKRRARVVRAADRRVTEPRPPPRSDWSAASLKGWATRRARAAAHAQDDADDA